MNLAISVGDPAGIGPEIVAKSLSRVSESSTRLFIFGGGPTFLDWLDRLGSDVEVQEFSHVSQATPENSDSRVIVVPILPDREDGIEPGIVSAEAGHQSVEYIKAAVSACLDGACDALVTGPINKQSLVAAGHESIGHTELLADLCDRRRSEVETVFFNDEMTVFFATRHQSLKAMIGTLSVGRIATALRNAGAFMRSIGVERPHIALAALNPHASDNGLFGNEEADILMPAVDMLNDDVDLVVTGPVPADTLFARHRGGEFDGVMSLYHDQGHIATKTVDLNGTYSVSTGLPFLRTSVDHGTAFDIAGQGVADPRNLLAALHGAERLTRRRSSLGAR